MEGIFASPTTYELAALFPDPEERVVNGELHHGRRRDHPNWMYSIYLQAIWVFRGERAAIAHMSDPSQQRLFAGWMLHYHQPHPDRRWKGPMTRKQLRHFRDRWLMDDNLWSQLRLAFEGAAIRQARLLGLGSSEHGGSFREPERARSIVMDSTVVKSMYTSEAGTMVTRKDGSTYEKKYDPDAMIYPEGGGGKAYGTKFLLAEIRDALKHKRVVLSVEHVPLRGKRRKMAAVAANPSYAEHLKEEDGKTELEYVLETSDRLLPQMSDVQALIHDAAARGKDIQHVMTTHGRLLVTPVHKVKDKETKERLPRRHPIETRKVKVGGHVVSLALVAEDGALGYEEVDATGKKHFRQLELRTVDRYAGRKPGDPWRWYGVYKLPAKYGGRTIRVSLTQGKREKFKRTEHLRAVAPPYPAYKEVYGRRNAIESLNDILDDWSNQHRRGHSVGHRRMRIGMLAFGLVINAQSLYLFNKNRDAQGAWAGPPQPVQAYPPLDQAA